MLLILSCKWKRDRTVNNYTEKHCYDRGSKDISDFVSLYTAREYAINAENIYIFISNFLITTSCAVGVNVEKQVLEQSQSSSV